MMHVRQQLDLNYAVRGAGFDCVSDDLCPRLSDAISLQAVRIKEGLL